MTNIPTYISTDARSVASYWYCHNFHNGLNDWRYRHMCNSRYQPSPNETLVEWMGNSEVMEALDWFVERFES